MLNSLLSAKRAKDDFFKHLKALIFYSLDLFKAHWSLFQLSTHFLLDDVIVSSAN